MRFLAAGGGGIGGGAGRSEEVAAGDAWAAAAATSGRGEVGLLTLLGCLARGLTGMGEVERGTEAPPIPPIIDSVGQHGSPAAAAAAAAGAADVARGEGEGEMAESFRPERVDGRGEGVGEEWAGEKAEVREAETRGDLCSSL